MRLPTTSICCSIAMLFALAACAATPSEGNSAAAVETSTAPRVGTFDSRGVALAYGRSPREDCMLAKVSAIRKEHAQATSDNNEDRATELEREAVAMQEQIHKQVFSGAPIPEILALIEDDLPQVAEAANVQLIVRGVLHTGKGFEVVDITMEMCAPFKLDDKTRKMIEDLMDQPVVPESELDHDH